MIIIDTVVRKLFMFFDFMMSNCNVKNIIAGRFIPLETSEKSIDRISESNQERLYGNAYIWNRQVVVRNPGSLFPLCHTTV